MSGPDARRRRLLFRASHRGTHENDLMIGGYVAERIMTLTELELDALEALLEWPDTDLADWLTGRRPIPHEVATPLLLSIRAHVTAGGAVSRP
jgi:antitoxin CptB